MIVTAVKTSMEASEQTTDRHNPRQAALYAGLVLEEVAELLTNLGGDTQAGHGFELTYMARALDTLGEAFKRGEMDHLLEKVDRGALLDDVADIAWVATCLGYSIGAYMTGAITEVANSNMSKINPATGKIDRNPETGKWLKGPNFFPPRLAQYLHGGAA